GTFELPRSPRRLWGEAWARPNPAAWFRPAPLAGGGLRIRRDEHLRGAFVQVASRRPHRSRPVRLLPAKCARRRGGRYPHRCSAAYLRAERRAARRASPGGDGLLGVALDRWFRRT